MRVFHDIIIGAATQFGRNLNILINLYVIKLVTFIATSCLFMVMTPNWGSCNSGGKNNSDTQRTGSAKFNNRSNWHLWMRNYKVTNKFSRCKYLITSTGRHRFFHISFSNAIDCTECLIHDDFSMDEKFTYSKFSNKWYLIVMRLLQTNSNTIYDDMSWQCIIHYGEPFFRLHIHCS